MNLKQQRRQRTVAAPCILLLLQLTLVVPVTARHTSGTSAADESNIPAQITALVIDGKLQPEADVTKVAVTRAATANAPEGAKSNMVLYANDKIETFAGASVKLLYWNPTSEKSNELTIREESQVIIGSGYCWRFCQWAADLKDTFYGGYANVRLSNQGTNYDLKVNKDGSATVLVYDGAVLVEKLPTNSAPTPVGSPTDTARGPNESQPYYFHDARETPCKEAAESTARCVESLHALELPADTAEPLPTPEKLDEARVREALLWSSHVEIAAHPNNRAEENGQLLRKANYTADEDRDKEFIEARFRSLWDKQPESYFKLAKVYQDWGENQKTLRFTEVARTLYNQTPGWQEPADFLYTEAEALMRTGNYAKAIEKVDLAQGRDPQSLARAMDIRGAIIFGEANVDLKENDLASANQLIDLAQKQFSDGVHNVKDSEYNSMFRTNKALTLKAQGNIAFLEGDFSKAYKQFDLAEEELKFVFKLKEQSNQSFSFGENAVADIYRDKFRVYSVWKNPRADAAEARTILTYQKAIENNVSFAEAHCGLASTYFLANKDDLARKASEACVAYGPTTANSKVEVPSLVGSTKATAAIGFLEAGVVPKFVGVGNIVIGQTFAAGQKVRRGAVVVVQLGLRVLF
jgi:tetratricopeptide (TPR) repeat protein